MTAPLTLEALARLRELLAEAEAFDGQHGCLSHLTSAECAGCVAECALTETLREHARALLDAAGEVQDWRTGRMADRTGHMLRCAKIGGAWTCAEGCAVRERDGWKHDAELIAAQRDEALKWHDALQARVTAVEGEGDMSQADGGGTVRLSTRVAELCVRQIGMGACVPRWYWPVRRAPNLAEWECWLWWLAPWVLGWHILGGCGRALWGDLVVWADAMRQRGD